MSENKNNPLVSVIIPIYNSELYLEQCMNSIITQSYSNLEIVLVDDGSTDNSKIMCDTYASQDARVKCYHQKNAGQAVARNLGIEKIHGNYIVFVDSDDYITDNHIQRMLEIALKFDADIVQCYAQKFWQNKRKDFITQRQKEITCYNASEALREFCYQREFNPSPCGKLIRTELMNGLEFPVGMGYEDFAIMYKLLGKAQKLVLIPEIQYYYRQHMASTMHNPFSEKKVDRIYIAEELKQYIDSNFPENKNAVKTRYLLANFQLLMDLPFNREYRELRKKIKNNITLTRYDVLLDSESKKDIRVMALASYCGVPILMCLSRIYKWYAYKSCTK